MYATVYLVLVLSVLATPIACIAGRRMAPDVAAKFLCATSLVASICLVWALGLLSGAAVGSEARGWWSAVGSPVPIPVPDWVSVTASFALIVAMARCLHMAVRHASLRREADAFLESRAQSDLVIVDDPTPRAFTLWGTSARIVVTTGMLRALPPVERRVLLAHERAHLAHHHHRYQVTMRLAVALNPAVDAMSPNLNYALERWADEDAAAVVGDRPAAAESLARAALLTTEPRASSTLAYAGLGVVDRVAALRDEPPTRRRLIGIFCFGIVAGPAAAALIDATLSFVRLLDNVGVVHR